MIYNNIKRNVNNIVNVKNIVTISYVNGATVNISGNIPATYRVQFFDKRKNVIHLKLKLRIIVGLNVI